jgi:hypothetical protein
MPAGRGGGSRCNEVNGGCSPLPLRQEAEARSHERRLMLTVVSGENMPASMAAGKGGGGGGQGEEVKGGVKFGDRERCQMRQDQWKSKNAKMHKSASAQVIT